MQLIGALRMAINLTNIESMVEVFTDLSIWMGIRGIIEKINSNAAAA